LRREPERTDSVIFTARLDGLSLDKTPASREATPTCSAVGQTTPIVSKNETGKKLIPAQPQIEGPAQKRQTDGGKRRLVQTIKYKDY